LKYQSDPGEEGSDDEEKEKEEENDEEGESEDASEDEWENEGYGFKGRRGPKLPGRLTQSI